VGVGVGVGVGLGVRLCICDRLPCRAYHAFSIVSYEICMPEGKSKAHSII
jgi:hypothetical protein